MSVQKKQQYHLPQSMDSHHRRRSSIISGIFGKLKPSHRPERGPSNQSLGVRSSENGRNAFETDSAYREVGVDPNGLTGWRIPEDLPIGERIELELATDTSPATADDIDANEPKDSCYRGHSIRRSNGVTMTPHHAQPHDRSSSLSPNTMDIQGDPRRNPVPNIQANPAQGMGPSSSPLAPQRTSSLKASRSRVLVEQMEMRRQERRSLKASGDWLGVTGANPVTGQCEILTPTDTLSSVSNSPDTRQIIERLSPGVTEAKLQYKRAKDAEMYERERINARRDQPKLERIGSAKEGSNSLVGRPMRRLSGPSRGRHWSSAAEPNLSPIAGSVRSGNLVGTSQMGTPASASENMVSKCSVPPMTDASDGLPEPCLSRSDTVVHTPRQRDSGISIIFPTPPFSSTQNARDLDGAPRYGKKGKEGDHDPFLGDEDHLRLRDMTNQATEPGHAHHNGLATAISSPMMLVPGTETARATDHFGGLVIPDSDLGLGLLGRKEERSEAKAEGEVVLTNGLRKTKEGCESSSSPEGSLGIHPHLEIGDRDSRRSSSGHPETSVIGTVLTPKEEEKDLRSSDDTFRRKPQLLLFPPQPQEQRDRDQNTDPATAISYQSKSIGNTKLQYSPAFLQLEKVLSPSMSSGQRKMDRVERKFGRILHKSRSLLLSGGNSISASEQSPTPLPKEPIPLDTMTRNRTGPERTTTTDHVSREDVQPFPDENDNQEPTPKTNYKEQASLQVKREPIPHGLAGTDLPLSASTRTITTTGFDHAQPIRSLEAAPNPTILQASGMEKKRNNENENLQVDQRALNPPKQGSSNKLSTSQGPNQSTSNVSKSTLRESTKPDCPPVVVRSGSLNLKQSPATPEYGTVFIKPHHAVSAIVTAPPRMQTPATMSREQSMQLEDRGSPRILHTLRVNKQHKHFSRLRRKTASAEDLLKMRRNLVSLSSAPDHKKRYCSGPTRIQLSQRQTSDPSMRNATIQNAATVAFENGRAREIEIVARSRCDQQQQPVTPPSEEELSRISTARRLKTLFDGRHSSPTLVSGQKMRKGEEDGETRGTSSHRHHVHHHPAHEHNNTNGDRNGDASVAIVDLSGNPTTIPLDKATKTSLAESCAEERRRRRARLPNRDKTSPVSILRSTHQDEDVEARRAKELDSIAIVFFTISLFPRLILILVNIWVDMVRPVFNSESGLMRRWATRQSTWADLGVFLAAVALGFVMGWVGLRVYRVFV